MSVYVHVVMFTPHDVVMFGRAGALLNQCLCLYECFSAFIAYSDILLRHCAVTATMTMSIPYTHQIFPKWLEQ